MQVKLLNFTTIEVVVGLIKIEEYQGQQATSVLQFFTISTICIQSIGPKSLLIGQMVDQKDRLTKIQAE